MNMSLSGITEITGEREKLLDDIIQRIYELHELGRAEK